MLQRFLDDIVEEQLIFRKLPIRSVVFKELSFGGQPLSFKSEKCGGGVAQQKECILSIALH
jgi:hypothetical protein